MRRKTAAPVQMEDLINLAHASPEQLGRDQNRARDYDPYEINSRQPTRSGNFVDVGQSPRGPANMKSLLANQQAAGRRMSSSSATANNVSHKEGPNWILIAGGALVTALGVLIVRKQKPASPQSKGQEKSPTLRKEHVQQSGLSFDTTRRESTGSRTSELSTDSPYSGDPFMLSHTLPQSLSEGSRVGSEWGDEECSPISPPPTYYAQFTKGSNHSSRTVITPTSPPGSYRGADTSATECNDPAALSPPTRLGFSSRRDMVHRLRQQLKSRDEMILDMQAQISDQERIISLHQAHCRELEEQLEDASTTLLESEQEIQRLRKAVAEYLAGHVPNSLHWDSSSAPDRRDSGYEINRPDDSFLLREARRLAEELQAREDEKQELERLASVRIKEHELVVHKLGKLEAQLEEARKSDFGKDLLLEAYEVEHENLEDKVDNLKRLIETKTPEKSPASSMIGRNSLSGGLSILLLDNEQKGHREENGNFKAEDFRLQARNLVRSYSWLLERNFEKAPADVSSIKVRLKTDESSSNGDVSDESETEDLNPAFSEKLFVKLQQEVEQLSIVLAEHSDMVSLKRLETSRLVDEFQRHNALISDIQKRMDEDLEGTPESREPDWKHHSQCLSFSNDATSAAQVQELSHKLEQIAKQQRVEQEIAELSKHQVKIAELKQRVEKLLNKCNSLQDSEGNVDSAANEQAIKMAAAGTELAKQLDLQEEQAMRTSREVQRLSASFQLSSPYVPRSKKEELQKMLQSCSSESLSPRLEIGPPDPANMSHVVSGPQSRFSTASEGKPKESGDVLFDRAISVSSAELATTTPQIEGVLTLQTEEQYVYRPGISGPSARKLRRGFPINSGLGKEQPAGAKKRMARGVKKGASREPKELVRSDSNRWVNRASEVSDGSSPDSSSNHQSFLDSTDHLKQPSPKRNSSVLEETGGSGVCANDDSIQHSTAGSAYTPVGDIPWVRPISPVDSRRQSCGSLSDSSTMRIGSPTIAGHNVSLEASIDSTKGSFGRFLFDIETGEEVYAMNDDDSSYNDLTVDETIPLGLPCCTQTMAKMDLKEVSSTSSSQDCCSSTDNLGGNISGLSKDMLNAIRGSPQKCGTDKNSGPSESSISIGSSFDALLSNTLDDLVLVCSAPSTPLETPDSSSFMSSKSDAYFQL